MAVLKTIEMVMVMMDDGGGGGDDTDVWRW